MTDSGGVAMMLFDGRGMWMDTFISHLHGVLKAEPIPMRADGGWTARVPEGAEVGYVLTASPQPGYQRCVMITPLDAVEELQHCVADVVQMNHNFTAYLARERAAEIVPQLLRQSGLAQEGEVLRLSGSPEGGGMLALRDRLMQPDVVDLAPGEAGAAYTIVQVGRAIIYTMSYEVRSLDPFAAMEIYGSAADKAGLLRLYEAGERNGPPAPDRRAEAHQPVAERMDATRVEIILVDGGHRQKPRLH